MEDVLSLPLVRSEEKKKKRPRPPPFDESTARYMTIIIAQSVHGVCFSYLNDAVVLVLSERYRLYPYALAAVAIHLILPFKLFLDGEWETKALRIKTVTRWVFSLFCIGYGLAAFLSQNVTMSSWGRKRLGALTAELSLIILVLLWGRAGILRQKHVRILVFINLILVIMDLSFVLGSFH